MNNKTFLIFISTYIRFVSYFYINYFKCIKYMIYDYIKRQNAIIIVNKQAKQWRNFLICCDNEYYSVI